jgi:hypothetical protein
MMHHTAFSPWVFSRPDPSGPHRKLACGIRLTTIIAGLTVTVAIFASLTSVAIGQTAPKNGLVCLKPFCSDTAPCAS